MHWWHWQGCCQGTIFMRQREYKMYHLYTYKMYHLYKYKMYHLYKMSHLSQSSFHLLCNGVLAAKYLLIDTQNCDSTTHVH